MAESRPPARLSHEGGVEAASPTGFGAPLATVHGFPTPSGRLDLELHVGDIVHLRGSNGCGKTSLLRGLAGLDAPMRGRNLVGGLDPRQLDGQALATGVRAVWSSPRATLVGLTVEGEFRLRRLQIPTACAPLAARDVATLSSGESRRVALATAAASPAPLLLLDEPYDALDEPGKQALTDLVTLAARTGAVVIADHSGWASQIATRVLDLSPPQPAIDLILARPAAGRFLVASATNVTRGTTRLNLPAVQLGPGFHAVIGRNGAGKSTLLQRLSGLQDAHGVLLAGEPPMPGVNVRLLQPDSGDLLMARTVRDELTHLRDPEGLVPPALLDRHPLSLSAGEAQRVALVKALGRPAALHLLDEPEAHLDSDARWRLLAAIARRLADGACVVAATQDAGFIAAAHSCVEVGA